MQVITHIDTHIASHIISHRLEELLIKQISPSFVAFL